MLKQKVLILTILLALLLSACAGSGQTAGDQPANAQSPAAQSGAAQEGANPGTPMPGGQPGEMPKGMKLAIGTLKLEGTPNAVTAGQAKELLTLWKAVRSLTNSDTAAQKEVDALFNQIEKAMTDEQMAAINTLEINRDTLTSLGIEMGGPQGTLDPGIQATMQAARQTAVAGGQTQGQGGGPGGFGGPPPGGMGGGPGMGGPMGSDSGLSDEARATANAQRGPTGARPGIPPALLGAIIQLLESKG